MEAGDLNSIKNEIEAMNKFHQVAILRILKQDSSVTLNENKNGVFVNLTELPGDKVSELEDYVNYVRMQEDQLSQLEDKKEKFINQFYGPGSDASGTRKHVILTQKGDDDDNQNSNKEKKPRNIKVVNATRVG